jgi:hypothetical protein
MTAVAGAELSVLFDLRAELRALACLHQEGIRGTA